MVLRMSAFFSRWWNLNIDTSFNITNCPPPIKDRVGDFWFLGVGRGGVFFVCSGGRRVHIGGLAKIDCDWEGDSTLKNWIVYLLFYCLDLARCIVVQYRLCFHMYLLLYRSIVFLKTERCWTKIYVQNFFLHFEYYGFLTLFRIIVALITCVESVSFILLWVLFRFSRFTCIGDIICDMIPVYYFIIV